MLSKLKKYQESNEALQQLLLSDSAYKNSFKESIFQLLSENYRNLGDVENEIKYTVLYNKLYENSSLTKKKVRINILDIFDLSQHEKYSKWERKFTLFSYILYSFLILIILGFTLKILRNKKQNSILEQQMSLVDSKKNQSFVIPHKTELLILEKLEEFEKNNVFLKKEISLTTLAEEFDTNNTYLSEIINKHKQKNFKTYLNELKIHYIVDKLKNDPIYLSYKISYLANEAGFSSRTSFAVIFKTVMGITPSDYINSVHQNKKNEE